ncbi:MAG: glycosyltransferase family 9 protein [bacterium]
MKILVIRLSSLGDIVLTSSVVSSLKKRFPQSKLSFLVKKEYLKVLSLIEGIDEAISFNGIFPTIKKIKKEKFDLLIDLSSNLRTWLISILSGVKRRFSYNKDALKRLLLLFRLDLFKEKPHISEKYIKNLEGLGISYIKPSLSLSGINKKEILEKFGIKEGLVCGISPFSRHKNKIWSIDGYVGLIEKISKEFGCQIILFGNENDKELGLKIKSLCKVSIKDLIGKTDLIELSCLIERCFLFISPDTGPMHIADSLNVPVVALFGPTTRDFGFFPLRGIVVEKPLSCRPCSLHGGNKCRRDNKCMKMIGVDDIMGAIYAILNKKPYLPYKPNKILLIETAFLGDCLLTTPLIRGIKEVFPHSSLSLLARPIGCDALKNNPYISEFIPYDKDKKQKGLFSYLKIIKKIRAKNFSLAILPHRSARTTILSWFSNIPRRIGFSNASLSFLLTDKVYYDRKKHEAQRKLSLIKIFGDIPDERGLDVFIDDRARQKAGELFLKWGIKKDDILIGILPFSHWKTKRWLAEGFVKVIDRMAQYKAKAIIFGSVSDLNEAYKIQAMARNKPIIACGKISISELPLFFERCSLIIGNDTGIIHLAYGLNKKTIVILGPTTVEMGFGPYKTSSAIIVEKSIPCRPCSPHGPQKCPKGHFNCMKLITENDITIPAIKMLGIYS